MRFAELDAVTLDAYGTLLRLRDPGPALRQALAERGVERDAAAVGRAFQVEVEHYRTRTSTGRDPDSLHRLRVECAGVFLEAAGAGLDPVEFVGPYIDALVFELLPGTPEALRMLQARGLAVAVVSNWDVSLVDTVELLGLAPFVGAVVTSAHAGADKPDPAIFRLALERLGVEPGRALHIGDSPEDEAGAAAAGMRFAAAPVPAALARLEG